MAFTIAAGVSLQGLLLKVELIRHAAAAPAFL
jgi:hypothetical protein